MILSQLSTEAARKAVELLFAPLDHGVADY
jgi:hypothetical protein